MLLLHVPEIAAMHINDTIYNILAVDDDTDMLTIFSYLLKVRGYHIDISVNAQDLWEIIKTKAPDFIFLDIRMRGVNGMDLCLELKENDATKHIPVVLLSGNANVDKIYKDCKADGYLRKPFVIEEIMKEIDRLKKRLRTNTSRNQRIK